MTVNERDESQPIPPHANSDTALVRRFTRRDPAAFDEVHEMLRSRVYATIVRIVRNHFIAEELSQDVFLKAWQHCDQFELRDKRSLAGWVCRIARNRALDYVRSRECRMAKSTREVVPEDAPVSGLEVERNLTQAAHVRNLLGAIGRLDSRHRQVIAHIYVNGLTHVEAAEVAERPLGTVKTWVRQALSSLRSEMVQAVPVVSGFDARN